MHWTQPLDQHSSNMDSGDLNAWEYLTQKYDHANMFDDSDDYVDPSHAATQETQVPDVAVLPRNHRPNTIPMPKTVVMSSASHPNVPSYSHNYQLHHHPHFRDLLLQQQQCDSRFIDWQNLISSNQYLDPIAATTMPFTVSEEPQQHQQTASLYNCEPEPTHPTRMDSKSRIRKDEGFPESSTYDLEFPLFTKGMLHPYQQYKNTQLLLKPLSAYNYFFRDERDNILNNFTNDIDPLPPPVCDFTQTKMHALLYQHWYADPIKRKRVHRKAHGKVSFQILSKAVAKRWHDLPHEGQFFYRNVALLDKLYYQKELLNIKRSKSTSSISNDPTNSNECIALDETIVPVTSTFQEQHGTHM
jgi:hypothetical protein